MLHQLFDFTTKLIEIWKKTFLSLSLKKKREKKSYNLISQDKKKNFGNCKLGLIFLYVFQQGAMLNYNTHFLVRDSDKIR